MISQEDIEKKVKNVHFYRVPNTTTVICAIELHNGFVVTGEASSVFKPFDLEKGKEIALGKAKGKIWELEAYRYKEEEYEDRRPWAPIFLAPGERRKLCLEIIGEK